MKYLVTCILINIDIFWIYWNKDIAIHLTCFFNFVLRFFFFTWTIFKVFIEFVTTLLLSSGFLDTAAYGILAPQPEINPYNLHWKAKSTTGLPKKSVF